MGSSSPHCDALFASPTALALVAHLSGQPPPVTASPSPSSSCSTPSLLSSSNNHETYISDSQLCAICGDRATGKHYGCNRSCDGCKGFFRRSVRKSHVYRCRFNQACKIDKAHRNSCRYCRLQLCLRSGMRVDAIQNERDAIGKRRRMTEMDSEEGGGAFLQRLLSSESLCVQLRDSVIKNAGNLSSSNIRVASLHDVATSIHQQLVLTVEWAKSLPEFRILPLDDQASLLKANATSLIVLGVAIRSLQTENGICLGNDTVLPIDQAPLVGDITAVVGRIVQELVRPMIELSLDSREYVALKAVLFFNPYNGSTSMETSQILKQTRLAALEALRASLKVSPDSDCRLGQLLLILPGVQAVAQQLAEDVQLCRLFQLTNVDTLMQALILHDNSRTSDEERAVLVQQLTAATAAIAGGEYFKVEQME